MFFRMIRGMLTRQTSKMLMIGFTIALGASLATAMLAVMFDVSDKVNQELKTYGANITVVPKEASVISDLYEVEGGAESPAVYLREDELGKIKTIFWAFNIVDFAPFISEQVAVDGHNLTLVGSWFNHHMDLPTGEELDAGITSLRSWWEITDGRWLDEAKKGDDQRVMLGATAAESLGVGAGDTIRIKGSANSGTYEVAGVFSAGGDEDAQIFAPLDLVQALSNTDGKL